MALRIRLRQMGRRNRITYRVVVSEARSPRDGRFIETLGWYNPHATRPEDTLHIDQERALHWVQHGAQIADGTLPLLRRAAPEVIDLLRERVANRKARSRASRKD